MPRLVVVMPAKNAASTITSALGSTLRNLPKDSKIVVWNDGSTDQTLNAIDAVADSRVEVISSASSLGGGAARAALLQRTDSEFVANMDADDYCFPWRFSIQQKHVEKFDISFTATVKFGGRFRDLRPTNPLTYDATEVALSLAFHNALSHPSMYARRAALDKAGGYRDLKVAQDYDLWLRAAATGQRMGRIGVPCVGYRQARNQVSRQTGYAERIRAQSELSHAFVELLEAVEPGVGQRFSSLTSPAEKDACLESFLSKQLWKFRPSLRAYYSRLLRQKRLGPLAVA